MFKKRVPVQNRCYKQRDVCERRNISWAPLECTSMNRLNTHLGYRKPHFFIYLRQMKSRSCLIYSLSKIHSLSLGLLMSPRSLGSWKEHFSLWLSWWLLLAALSPLSTSLMSWSRSYWTRQAWLMISAINLTMVGLGCRLECSQFLPAHAAALMPLPSSTSLTENLPSLLGPV